MSIYENEIKYLSLLAKDFASVRAANAEIINLKAILNLPKGTEHFLSDIHGEADAFQHILRNASGTIKLRIDEVFPEMSDAERRTFATLIYYPKEKLEILKSGATDLNAFYEETLVKQIKLLNRVSFKYTRSYVRKKFPGEYAYILDELLYGSNAQSLGRANHRRDLIKSIIEIGVADDFIVALSDMICNIAIYKLHIVGDIFDRGAGSDVVLELLKNYHSVDIQWGNHDILWMGAAAGNDACIANVIRICTRYDNLHTLEVGYGISVRPLLTFAAETYADDPCSSFKAAVSIMDAMHQSDLQSLRKVGKAISVIQFKLEGQLIEKHPYYEMDALKLLHRIDYERGIITLEGKEYQLSDTNFPTIDPADPYRLTAEEEAVVERLRSAFIESKLLQDHVRFLFDKGSLYSCVNGNLLFHGCMPMTEDGEFAVMQTSDGPMIGKQWFDYADRLVRTGYFGKNCDPRKHRGIDFCWYLWCGYKSPLFGKKRITTFERMYIDDESTWVEEKNPYYTLMDRIDVIERILSEFGCNVEKGCVINGHIPVKKGENPVHAGGRAIMIDGGFSKAYQKTTGIAGYSLVQNSYGFILSSHEPFNTREKAIEDELDIHSTKIAGESDAVRMYNKDTDMGITLQAQIEGLQKLVEAYKTGIIKET